MSADELPTAIDDPIDHAQLLVHWQVLSRTQLCTKCSQQVNTARSAFEAIKVSFKLSMEEPYAEDQLAVAMCRTPQNCRSYSTYRISIAMIAVIILFVLSLWLLLLLVR